MAKEKYTDFHRARMGEHLYPSEFLVRTLLGSYPGLHFERPGIGCNVLDLGFGDGRNLPLLKNLGVEIFGVEPDPDVCAMVKARVAPRDIDCTLVPGTNAHIPFEDRFFDYVVASHSMYYVAKNETFTDNLREIARVMRPGGWLVATVPDLDNFILKSAHADGNGHFTITNDPYGLRNGTVFRAFGTTRDVVDAYEPWFEEFSFASFRDDWFGMLVSGFIVVCRRRLDQSSASIS